MRSQGINARNKWVTQLICAYLRQVKNIHPRCRNAQAGAFVLWRTQNSTAVSIRLFEKCLTLETVSTWLLWLLWKFYNRKTDSLSWLSTFCLVSVILLPLFASFSDAQTKIVHISNWQLIFEAICCGILWLVLAAKHQGLVQI